MATTYKGIGNRVSESKSDIIMKNITSTPTSKSTPSDPFGVKKDIPMSQVSPAQVERNIVTISRGSSSGSSRSSSSSSTPSDPFGVKKDIPMSQVSPEQVSRNIQKIQTPTSSRITSPLSSKDIPIKVSYGFTSPYISQDDVYRTVRQSVKFKVPANIDSTGYSTSKSLTDELNKNFLSSMEKIDPKGLRKLKKILERNKNLEELKKENPKVAELLVAQEEIGRLSQSQADFWKILPGLRGDSYIQKAVRYAFSLPTQAVTTAPLQFALTGGKFKTAVDNLKNDKTRSKMTNELLFSAKRTPKAFIDSINPENPEGLVNLLLLTTPAIIRGRQIVVNKFKEAPLPKGDTPISVLKDKKGNYAVKVKDGSVIRVPKEMNKFFEKAEIKGAPARFKKTEIANLENKVLRGETLSPTQLKNLRTANIKRTNKQLDKKVNTDVAKAIKDSKLKLTPSEKITYKQAYKNYLKNPSAGNLNKLKKLGDKFEISSGVRAIDKRIQARQKPKVTPSKKSTPIPKKRAEPKIISKREIDSALKGQKSTPTQRKQFEKLYAEYRRNPSEKTAKALQKLTEDIEVQTAVANIDKLISTRTQRIVSKKRILEQAISDLRAGKYSIKDKRVPRKPTPRKQYSKKQTKLLVDEINKNMAKATLLAETKQAREIYKKILEGKTIQMPSGVQRQLRIIFAKKEFQLSLAKLREIKAKKRQPKVALSKSKRKELKKIAKESKRKPVKRFDLNMEVSPLIKKGEYILKKPSGKFEVFTLDKNFQRVFSPSRTKDVTLSLVRELAILKRKGSELIGVPKYLRREISRLEIGRFSRRKSRKEDIRKGRAIAKIQDTLLKKPTVTRLSSSQVRKRKRKELVEKLREKEKLLRKEEEIIKRIISGEEVKGFIVEATPSGMTLKPVVPKGKITFVKDIIQKKNLPKDTIEKVNKEGTIQLLKNEKPSKIKNIVRFVKTRQKRLIQKQIKQTIQKTETKLKQVKKTISKVKQSVKKTNKSSSLSALASLSVVLSGFKKDLQNDVRQAQLLKIGQISAVKSDVINLVKKINKTLDDVAKINDDIKDDIVIGKVGGVKVIRPRPKPKRPKPTIVKPKPKIPKIIKKFEKLDWNTPLPKGFTYVVNARIKVGNQVKIITLNTTPNRARRKLNNLVDNTLLRSYDLFITGVTKQKDIPAPSMKKFRLRRGKDPKVRKFVEKSRYIADKKGETSRLQLARRLAKLRQEKKLKIKR